MKLSRRLWHWVIKKHKQRTKERAKAKYRTAYQNSGAGSGIEYTVQQYLRARRVFFEAQHVVRVWNQVEGKYVNRYIDIYIPSSKTAVEVNGCFWHQCRPCGHVNGYIARNMYYSNAKIVADGQERNKELWSKGINIICIWEHDIRRNNFSALAPLFQKM